MTAKETVQYLIDEAGLDAETAKKLVDNEKVIARAGQLRQASEYSDLERRAQELETAMNGANGKPGAKMYQEWYEKNYQAIQKLQQDSARYRERYGDLDAPAAGQPPAAAPVFDEAAVQKMVDARIQGQYGPQWSNLLKGSGKIIERHMRAGRKGEIDWDKIGEIASAKGGDLVQAYDEWDAPERDAAAKAATDAEIDRRVKEELAKRQTASFFPAAADASPSSTSPLSRSRVTSEPKYDRAKVIQAAITGEYGAN